MEAFESFYQTNQETVRFEQEMQKRGVPGNPKAFHTEQYGHKLVVVCFEQALKTIRMDGLAFVVESAARTVIGHGRDLSNWTGSNILELTFQDDDGKTIDVMTIITRHSMHGKTQFSVGMVNEMELQAEVIRLNFPAKPVRESLLKDGQNRSKSWFFSCFVLLDLRKQGKPRKGGPLIKIDSILPLPANLPANWKLLPEELTGNDGGVAKVWPTNGKGYVRTCDETGDVYVILRMDAENILLVSVSTDVVLSKDEALDILEELLQDRNFEMVSGPEHPKIWYFAALYVDKSDAAENTELAGMA